MDIRMLPIRHVFERFPRLVRDLAHGQGKQIELILQGEDTRVDKAVIDEIGEPLVHLIRNAVDHGIEPPAARAAAGKPPTGTILLSAAQESSQVVITLVDDGAGIDAAEVRRQAIEHGLLGADEKLSDREVVQLIFSEGFSTARSVTDVSGRGVGLDVVVRCMERLNGLIEAETIPGAGTKFILQLPLTLAIITVLMVEVGEQRLRPALGGGRREPALPSRRGVPDERPGHAARPRPHHSPGAPRRVLRGARRGPTKRQTYAVIVGRGEKRLGLTVDRLLGPAGRGDQGTRLRRSPATALGVAGATILGDGRVVLVLDVAALFESSRGRESRGATRAPTEA